MFKDVLHTISKLFATGLGVGYVPFAPGTFGTLLGALILAAFLMLPMFAPDTSVLVPIMWLGVTTACITIIGTFATHDYQLAYGKHDPKEVVIDEIAGFFLSIFLLALFFVWFVGQNKEAHLPYLQPFVFYYVLMYVLFRLFDIIKPWPINLVDQRMHSAWGVMLDDLIAGIYATISFILLFFLAKTTGLLALLI